MSDELVGVSQLFTVTQSQRAQALRIAREVCVTRTPAKAAFMQGGTEVLVPDLIDVAEFIVNGTHPEQFPLQSATIPKPDIFKPQVLIDRPCPQDAALIIAGEHYHCDQMDQMDHNSKDHSGWAHASKAAKAIWTCDGSKI
jgi:hypothetical protein